MKTFAWSWSALESFETCPWRHYLTRVAKLVQEKESDEMTWGKRVHKAFENYFTTGQPMASTLARYQGVAQGVEKKLAGSDDILVEQQWCINDGWESTGWFDKDAWCRAVVDLAAFKGTTGVAIDWKTGKRKEGFGQLSLTALVAFSKFPELEQIKCSYFWLKEKKADSKNFYREDENAMWSELEPRVVRFQEAFEFDNWPKRQSGLCRKHCPVGSNNCVHCGT